MMAQRIQTLCDQHLARDEEVDGMTYALSLRMPAGREQSYEVDLCDVCAKAIVELRDWLADAGRKSGQPAMVRSSRAKADAPGAASAAVVAAAGASNASKCPLCDFTTSQTKPRHAVNKHMREQHDTSLDEVSGVPLPFKCDKCSAAFKTAPALGTHIARSKDH